MLWVGPLRFAIGMEIKTCTDSKCNIVIVLLFLAVHPTTNQPTYQSKFKSGECVLRVVLVVHVPKYASELLCEAYWGLKK